MTTFRARADHAPHCASTGRAGVAASAHPLLRLQRAAGNAAVGRLVELQRAPGDGMLARGSSGEQVRATQIDLNALGATPQLEPDGKFGGGTDTAVRVFQRAHRLKPDGIVGPATSTMLRNERAIKGANFLVPCHTPEKPGPDGPEAKALDEEVDRRGGNLLGEPGAAKVNLTLILTTDPMDQDEAAAVGGKVVKVGSIAALNAELEKHKTSGCWRSSPMAASTARSGSGEPTRSSTRSPRR